MASRPHGDAPLGGVAAARGFPDFAVRLIRYRRGEEMGAHAHGTLGTTLIVSGGCLDTTEGRPVVCRPLTLIVKPADAEHETCVGPQGALTLHLEFSNAAVGQLGRAGVDTARCRYLRAGPATAALIALLDEREPGASCDALALVAGAILAGDRAGLPADTPIVDAYAARALFPTTRAAASASGMHPVSFARHFRRLAGVSPSRWRLQRRVSAAAGALAGGADSPASVAMACGFADQSHLGRLFKRETGLSPGRYRALVRAFQRSST